MSFEYPEENNSIKCAVVLPVYRNRNKKAAVEEAWEFERQLESACGYGIWLRGGRESLDVPPSSTSLRDLQGFSSWFNERKRNNDLDGVFIMIMYRKQFSQISHIL